MTVQQLIELLQKCPKDDTVVLLSERGVFHPETVRRYINPTTRDSEVGIKHNFRRVKGWDD